MTRRCSTRSPAWSPRTSTRNSREPPLPPTSDVEVGGSGLRSAGTLDVPAPGAGLGAAALDELLELLRVRLDLAVVEAEGGARLLDQALGLPVDLDHHPGLAVVQAVERDHARVLRLAAGAAPGDALLGCCSVISASNSRCTPSMFVTQCVWVPSSWVMRSTPPMNWGKDSNCVHWS